MSQWDLRGFSNQELFDAMVFNDQQRDLAQASGDRDGVDTCDAYLRVINDEMQERQKGRRS